MGKNEIDDMNMITMEPQNNQKNCRRILKNLQNQIPNMSTPSTMHLYLNKNHTHVDHNPQQPKL
jgi:hypothetical protein